VAAKAARHTPHQIVCATRCVCNKAWLPVLSQLASCSTHMLLASTLPWALQGCQSGNGCNTCAARSNRRHQEQQQHQAVSPFRQHSKTTMTIAHASMDCLTQSWLLQRPHTMHKWGLCHTEYAVCPAPGRLLWLHAGDQVPGLWSPMPRPAYGG
jgi:hypothetical protein